MVGAMQGDEEHHLLPYPTSPLAKMTLAWEPL